MSKTRNLRNPQFAKTTSALPKPRSKPERPKLKKSIVLVGGHRSRQLIERSLRNFDVTFVQADWKETLKRYLNDNVIAVILTETPPSGTIAKHVLSLRAKLPDAIAVVAIAPEDTSDQHVRGIYKAGAAVVFKWPLESLLLAPVLTQILAIRLVRGPIKESDRALARVIKAHCKTFLPSSDWGLRVYCQAGAVELAGEVPELWQKNQLERRVKTVPGVVEVVLHQVTVAPTSLSDRQIRSSVQGLLKGVTEHTVAVSVSRGHVILAGTVGSNSEVHRLFELVSHIRGVREIENLLVVGTPENDRKLATRINNALKVKFPDAALDAVVFGRNIVISGVINCMTDRWEALDIIKNFVGSSRIIDKIKVKEKKR